MNSMINIIHVEDNPVDAELVRTQLEVAGLQCRITLIQTYDELESILHRDEFDLVLANDRLPGCDGLSALKLVKELRADVPFIFISGTKEDEIVIECLTQGATDFVLKENVGRLKFAVIRALEEAKNRREYYQKMNALKESEAKLQSILDNIGIGVSLISPKMEILELNKRMRQWFPDIDYSQHPICYKAFNNPPRNDVCSYCPTHKTLKDGRIHEAATDTPQGGEIKNYRIISTPILSAAGEIVAAIEMVEDITEQKKANEALQHSNEMLRAIIEAAPTAIIGLDLDGNVHSVWNPAAEKMLGWSAQEAFGHPLPSVPLDHQEEFTRFRERIRKGLTLDGVEVCRQRRDGTPIDYSIYASPLHDAQGNISGNIAVLVDITGRKRVEESVRKLSQAIEQSPVSIIITDTQGSIEFVNNTFTRITGYTFEEVRGQNPRIFKSGETSVEEYRSFWKTISAGGVWQGEFHNRKKNGELFWELATIAPIRDSDHAITHYVAIKEDITGRKKLEEKLRQTQRMEAIGQLAGGVAHDFNNMLGVIIGYAELALKKVAWDDPLHEALDRILAAGLRSSEVTRQLLAFARKQTIIPKIIDINETVEGMLKLFRRLIGEDIDLAWHPGKNLWPVKMDSTQIDQILANLCINARDAITGVGKVTIETQKAVLDEAYCDEHKGFSPGEYVMLAVSDSGCGMDQRTIEKIFEPFFTTKGVGRGTGLGLATVYGIVKQNAGFINVYSEVGQGSTFKIYLPRHIVQTEPRRKEIPTTSTAKGSETILLVEDESAFLEIVKRMLENSGYHVLTSSAPAEAIQIAGEYSGEIEMIITDVVMPEMTGRDLVKCLNSCYPKLKHLFMSGYTANVIAHHGILDEGVNFIQKPFLEQELALKVREVLDSV